MKLGRSLRSTANLASNHRKATVRRLIQLLSTTSPAISHPDVTVKCICTAARTVFDALHEETVLVLLLVVVVVVLLHLIIVINIIVNKLAHASGLVE